MLEKITMYGQFMVIPTQEPQEVIRNGLSQKPLAGCICHDEHTYHDISQHQLSDVIIKIVKVKEIYSQQQYQRKQQQV